MNIFAVDSDPVRAAQALGNRHVVKMVLETAQILSTVWCSHSAAPPQGIYKPTHRHHPCVLWAAASSENYQWAWQHGIALAHEYTHRYKRQHKSESVLALMSLPPESLASTPRSPFAQAMPAVYQQADPIAAYRDYYRHEKQHLHEWTHRAAPEWL